MSLGSFSRAELREEVTSILNYSLNTYSVCLEQGHSRAPGQQKPPQQTTLQLCNSGEGKRSGSKTHQARVGDPRALWPRHQE